MIFFVITHVNSVLCSVMLQVLTVCFIMNQDISLAFQCRFPSQGQHSCTDEVNILYSSNTSESHLPIWSMDCRDYKLINVAYTSCIQIDQMTSTNLITCIYVMTTSYIYCIKIILVCVSGFYATCQLCKCIKSNTCICVCLIRLFEWEQWGLCKYLKLHL